MARRLRVATRGSALARWQADHVASLLDVDVDVVVVETTGDQRRDVPISALGGRGVFVKEVQAAVLDGRADLAVHSAKDLPSSPELQPDGLVIAAVPPRGDPRDALVGSTLADVPSGGRVATGSVRRRAQLAWLRPDLSFPDLRGNIDTRLAKAADHDAIVMALAALQRLGLEDRVAEVLEPEVMVPQVSQGALAIECRADDGEARERLAAIEDWASRVAVDAERGFLAELGGGCDLPVGALATVEGSMVSLVGLIATLDGRSVLRHTMSGSADDAVSVGAGVAAYLLDNAGGRMLLGEVEKP
jgi:hydroxymethylbilane synthase